MREVAIVTGAASGIGFAIADHLLEKDAALRCAVVDVVTGWSNELAARHGAERVLEFGVDVADHQAVHACVRAIAERLGVPTQLVNAAGVQFNCPSLELAYEDWGRVLAVNLGGTFSFCQAAGARMVEARRGAIVNIASVSMYFGLPRRLPYVASKAAVGGLTATLAAEWAEHGVRVNAIAPGFIETPLAAEAFRRGHVDRSRAEAAHAMARMGQPTEVASCGALPPLRRGDLHHRRGARGRRRSADQVPALTGGGMGSWSPARR